VTGGDPVLGEQYCIMGQTSYMQCKTASFFHYWQ